MTTLITAAKGTIISEGHKKLQQFFVFVFLCQFCYIFLPVFKCLLVFESLHFVSNNNQIHNSIRYKPERLAVLYLSGLQHSLFHYSWSHPQIRHSRRLQQSSSEGAEGSQSLQMSSKPQIHKPITLPAERTRKTLLQYYTDVNTRHLTIRY